MTTIWEVPGQAHAVRVMRDAAEHDRVGHAWALVGPADVGQEALVRSLVAAVNCAERPGGCGVCASCRRSLRGAHPSYREFAPTGATHRVGEVRDVWLRAASRTADAGTVKVLRVLDADRMNDASANAFLKALEEPPPGTVWLLELADPDELPDTILSRCRVVRVSPLDRKTMWAMASRAEGSDDPPPDATVERAVRAAMGAPSRARSLLRDGGLDDLSMHRRIPRELRERGPGYALIASKALDGEMQRAVAEVRQERKRQEAHLTEEFRGAPPADVMRAIEQRSARQEREAKTVVAQTALDDLAAWYRDVLLIRCGGDASAAIHADDVDGLRADAAVLDERVLLHSIETIFLRREQLEFNVGLSLAIEALLLELSTLALAG